MTLLTAFLTKDKNVNPPNLADLLADIEVMRASASPIAVSVGDVLKEAVSKSDFSEILAYLKPDNSWQAVLAKVKTANANFPIAAITLSATRRYYVMMWLNEEKAHAIYDGLSLLNLNASQELHQNWLILEIDPTTAVVGAQPVAKFESLNQQTRTGYMLYHAFIPHELDLYRQEVAQLHLALQGDYLQVGGSLVEDFEVRQKLRDIAPKF